MWRCSETKIERIESGRDEAREIYNEAERAREREAKRIQSSSVLSTSNNITHQNEQH